MTESGTTDPIVAYFSMEIGLRADIPTYSGGLGVLAGDTLKEAADLRIPMVGISLLHRKGYFRQKLDAGGNQIEESETWSPQDWLERLPERITVIIEDREVRVALWRRRVKGLTGHVVPVYFLDCDLPENLPEHRSLTDQLYAGDIRYRLCQELLLGYGGVELLRTLGFDGPNIHHMNEGHSALLGLALFENRTGGQETPLIFADIREAVRRSCVFTTHTPVPAGHDQFPTDLVRRVLGERRTAILDRLGCCLNGTLNMTFLALAFSRFVNGVAMRHRQVSRNMFPQYPIHSITNGVHAPTWTAPPFKDLFDHHIPSWRLQTLNLRYAIGIPLDEIRMAHQACKERLIEETEKRTGVRLDPDVFTIGFARRATPYKRADLFFSDPDRLRRIGRRAGPLQVIFAGKAHPRDGGGKEIIRRIFERLHQIEDSVHGVYLPGYDIDIARWLCAGVDLWLNTPQKPLEASGTSGMKAAMNGVPSLSVLDGWWIEGHVEGVTGWSIGTEFDKESDPGDEADDIYHKLEFQILPTYYHRPERFDRIRRASIYLNGAFFNTQRMLIQYLQNAYRILKQV